MCSSDLNQSSIKTLFDKSMPSKKKQKRKIDPSACVGTGAEICNGCMFTVYKRFWKIRLESKWNMPFLGRSRRKFPGAMKHL